MRSIGGFSGGRKISLIATVFVLLVLLRGATALIYAQSVDKPETVTIAGTMQSKLGCPGDWQPTCSATYLTLDEEDDVWQEAREMPAGDYEYKVAINQSWDENYGLNAESFGPNIPLSVTEARGVKFYYDHKTHWVTDNINAIIATVIGSFQDELGCANGWDPGCLRSWLQDPDGDGAYVFITQALPAGTYQAKVAIDESLDENYGLNGARDGAEIEFTVPTHGAEIYFGYDAESHVLNISTEGAPKGDLKKARAHWLARDTIAWDVDTNWAETFTLHYSIDGELALSPRGVEGGQEIGLSLDENGLSDEIRSKFPHLRNLSTLKIGSEDLDKVATALKGQVAVSALDAEGKPVDATSLQIPGVLDDLYTYDGSLGVIFDGDVPTLKIWAPTAQSVKLLLFDDSDPDSNPRELPLDGDPDSGVWSISGAPDWAGKYYLYAVEVYVPSTGRVENNLVTDPYAVSLSMNSTRSQIVSLSDPSLMPPGDWQTLEKPPLDAPEDIVIYELHVRDFSVNDASVPEEKRGTFLAFAEVESNGMRHLRSLAEAGLTHIHLLPVFDIATINENKAEWEQADFDELAGLPPDSDRQQEIVSAYRGRDGYNWGYDPFHYTVPEGSYSTDPDGSARILEFRQMVQALNQAGLRVVMDVVYNHTNASGQSEKSVLDKVVPGYYHRLNADGKVENSTCCENTATEHNMMRKLMVDSVVTWATAYKVDGFRFDLMGHHMVDDMVAVKAALQSLTLEKDGVDGSRIYIYGEGWDFGEVANKARGVNAAQLNVGGLGIGTFNDRVRDAVRGGTPFGGLLEQGFINGLYYDPNTGEQRSENEQRVALMQFADQIRVSLAGNLANYAFVNWKGQSVKGADVDYNGSPAGYTQDPQENIIYISAHDNETLFDAIQYKAPTEASVAERVRMQNMGLSIVALAQGVPFFHAGVDMLRSKSFDRDSFDSGDWFNKLDFTYQDNNWGVGLPPADKNKSNWPLMQSLLARPELKPAPSDILNSDTHFQEMLRIRRSSSLFRLRSAEEVQERLRFHNTGLNQVLGMIVLSLSDVGVSTNLDPNYDLILVVFNATNEEQRFALSALRGIALELHPVQAASNDPVVRTAAFDAGTGGFVVPARTTAVFVVPEGSASELRLDSEDRIEAEVRLEPEPTATRSEPTATVPEPTPTSLEPSLPSPTPTPEPLDTSAPLWPWLVAVLAVIGGAATWAWRRLR
jgi:pullulanase